MPERQHESQRSVGDLLTVEITENRPVRADLSARFGMLAAESRPSLSTRCRHSNRPPTYLGTPHLDLK
jgi:hypothetical protein